MGEIKSALEMALERTANVAGDKKKLAAHEAKQEGMKLAGTFLDDPSNDLKKQIDAYDRDRRISVRQGAFQVLLAQVALPVKESDLERLGPVEKGLSQLVRQPGSVESVMSQVGQLLQQYLDTRAQMIEQLRQQFEPRVRQREEQLAQQTGQRVKLDPSSDPEFAQYLEQNNQHLQQQYGAVVKQAKEQLTALFEQS
jgi:hypothetical protein